MRMPEGLFLRRQTPEEALGDDVLDTDQVGVFRVPIEEHALEEVIVDPVAIMMSFHLHGGIVLRRVEANHVDVELLDGGHILEEVGAGFQEGTLEGLRFADWVVQPFSGFSHDDSLPNRSTNLAATS